MSEPLFRADGKLLSSGLYPDKPQRSAPLWATGRNAVFADGVVHPLVEQIEVGRTASGDTITAVLAREDEIFAGAKGEIVRYTETGGLDQVGSGYSLLEGKAWQFVPWSNWVLAVNGQDDTQVWKGSAFADLAGTDFTGAECIATWNNFAAVANFVVGGVRIPDALEWCAAGNVEQWVPSATNSADRRFLQDLDGGVRCLRASPTGFLAGGLNALVSINYTGDDFWFSVGRPLTGVGLVGKHAGGWAERFFYGFGPRGIFRTDLVGYEYIDEGAVRDTVLLDMGFTTFEELVAAKILDRIVFYHDPIQKMVCFYYPTKTDSCGKGVGFKYTEPSWTVLDAGRTAADESGILPYGVVADCTGRIYKQAMIDQPLQGPGGAMPMDDSRFAVGAGFGMGGFGQLSFGGLQSW